MQHANGLSICRFAEKQPFSKPQKKIIRNIRHKEPNKFQKIILETILPLQSTLIPGYRRRSNS